MNKKLVGITILLSALLASTLWLQQGCTGGPAPLSAMIATATPVLSPTPVNINDGFENNTTQGWFAAGGNVSGTVFSIISPGYGGSNYCINLYAPFTAINQTAGVTQAFSSLNLTGGGIQCEMWIDAGTVTGGYPGGQIFPSDGITTNYNFYSNLTQGSWTLLNLPLPSATYGTVNTGAIKSILIQAAVGGSGTAVPGNVKIDNIQIY